MLEDSSSDSDWWGDDSHPGSSREGDALTMALRSAVGIVADEDDVEDWDADFESQDHTTAESTSASLSKQGMNRFRLLMCSEEEVHPLFSTPSFGTRKLNQLKREMTISKSSLPRRPSICNLWSRPELEGIISDSILIDRLRNVHSNLLGK
jgi:hypothetical protein